MSSRPSRGQALAADRALTHEAGEVRAALERVLEQHLGPRERERAALSNAQRRDFDLLARAQPAVARAIATLTHHLVRE